MTGNGARRRLRGISPVVVVVTVLALMAGGLTAVYLPGSSSPHGTLSIQQPGSPGPVRHHPWWDPRGWFGGGHSTPKPPPIAWKAPTVKAARVLKADPHAKRVKELTNRRTANASFFQMSDGSVQEELSAVPVHYRDSNGTWQDINSSVKTVSHDGFTLGAVGNTFQTYFSSKPGSLVRLQQGSAFVQLGVDGASVSAAQVSGSTVTYKNADAGADISYQAGPDGLLEKIVLAKAPTAGMSFSFTLKVSGLTPMTLADGAIGFYGEGANPVFVIPAPYMADSKTDANSPYGTVYSPNVTQSATFDAATGTMHLTVTPDAKWLADSHRRYPVTVDPTIVVSPTPSQAANVMILADGPTTNYATSWRLSVGTTTTGAARSLIRFPLPTVPTGTTISSADLKLYYDQTFTDGSKNVAMQALAANAAWNPATATWNNASSIGGPVAGTATMTGNAVDVWNDFPVTSTVQAWLNGTSVNNGFVLKAASESTLGQGGPRYEGSIYAYGGEVVNYPKLVITYGVPGVAVNRPTVIHSTGAELSWPAYVNTTGNTDNDLAEYQVHRSVFQTFTPSASTEIAPIQNGATNFTDSTAVPTPANNSDPYGNAYYYMVVVKTKGGALIPGPTTLVRLPEAGRTTLLIPAASATTLSSAQPASVLGTLNNGGTAEPWLEVGDNSATYGTARAVFNFGALSAVPSGSKVLDAHLKLWQEQTTTSTSGAVYQLHALTRAFNGAQATWNSAATGTNWTSAGGDFTAVAGGTVSGLTNDPNRQNLDATSIVQGWVNTPASNDGLLVKLAAESSSSPQERTLFAGTKTAEPALAPTLVVTYLDTSTGSTYYAPSTPADMNPGTTYSVPVTINNTTSATWTAASEVLTYHWLLPDGTDITTPANQIQTALPADLAPAATVTLNAQVTPPTPSDGNQEEGATLAWDMYNKTTGVYLSGATSAASATSVTATGTTRSQGALLAPATSGSGTGSLGQQVSVDPAGNNQLGLEPYYSYATVPTGAGSTVNANDGSGNVVWHDALFANPSRGFTTSLGLSYNSLSTMDTGTGFGWTVDASSPVRLGQALQFHPQSNPTSVVMVDSTGNAHQWNLNTTTNTWASPPGEHLYLQQTKQCTQQTPNDPAWKMTRPDRTTVIFDCEGYPVSQSDANGNTAIFSYTDKQSQNKPEEFLQYITDPAGRQTLTLTYYQQGDASYNYIDSTGNLAAGTNLTDPSIVDHLKSVTDISGRTVNFYYTSEGLLGRVVDGAGDPAARTFNFGYLATQGMKNVKLVSVTDPDCSAKKQQGQACNPTSLVYYPDSSAFKWMAQTITDRDTHATGIAYVQPGTISGSFEQTTVTDANQGTAEYETDSAGRTLQVTDPLNHKTTQAWDADNNVISLTEDNGAQTKWTYDPNTGYPLTETDPLAVKNGTPAATWIYSTTNTTDQSLSGHIADLSATISAQGRQTSYTYDGNGNLTSKQAPDGTAGTTPGKPYLSTYTYDSTGEMLTSTDANGHAMDASGNITNVPGHTTIYNYGIPVPGTGGAITTPEPTGQPVSVTDPVGNSTDYTYDDRGNVTSVTDATGITSTASYTVYGQTDGGVVPQDTAGNKWVITPAPSYDFNGNVTSSTPSYIGSVPAGGGPATGTPVQGSSTLTSYDNMDQPTAKTLPDNLSGVTRTVTYGYDNLGNQTTVTQPVPAGQPASLYTVTTAYNKDSEPTSVSQPAADGTTRVTTYGYDSVGNRTDVTDPDLNHTHTDYDADHRKIDVISPTGAETFTGYDYDGLVTSITSQNGAPIGQAGATINYTLDSNGQVTQVGVPHGTDLTCSGTGCNTTQYDYDQVGNQTAVVSPKGFAAGATSGAYTTNTTYYGNNAVHQVLGAYLPNDPTYGADHRSETDYTYDPDGRVATTKQVTKAYTEQDINRAIPADNATTTYTYFDNGWTKTTTDPFGLTTDYQYNGQGQQVNRHLSSSGFADTVDQPSTTAPPGAQTVMHWDYNPDGSLHDYSDTGTPAGFQDQVITADNTQQSPAAWSTVQTGAGYNGSTDSQGLGIFTWNLDVPQSGEYQVYAWYSSAGDPSASYTVTHDNGNTQSPATVTDPAVPRNQTQEVGQWVPIGSAVYFTAGTDAPATGGIGQQVTLTSGSQTPAVADAVRIVRVGDTPGNTLPPPVEDNFTYSYDGNGNLSGVSDTSPTAQYGSYAQVYDNFGQLTQLTESGTAGQHTLGYTYDPAGNVLSQSQDAATGGPTSSYLYGTGNLLSQVTSQQSLTSPALTTNYGYTSDGRVATEVKGNGNVAAYTYYSDGTLHTAGETTAGNAAIDSQTLTYDPNGSVTDDKLALTDAGTGPTVNRESTLTYSPANQVTGISNSDGKDNQSYTYDSSGDVTQQQINGATEDFTYNHSRVATSYVPKGALSFTGNYFYDTMGRLTGTISGYTAGIPEATTQQYNYDGFGNDIYQSQSSVIAGVGSSTTTTQYDSMNRPISQSVATGSSTQPDGTVTPGPTGTSTTSYLGTSHTIASQSLNYGTGTVTENYDYSPTGQRLDRVDLQSSDAGPGTPTPHYYSYNQHGDVQAVTGADGSAEATYGYTAYGADDSSLDSGQDSALVGSPFGVFPFNSFRYTAAQADPATGNLALQGGIYSPGLSSFTSRDYTAPDGFGTLWKTLTSFGAGGAGFSLGAWLGAAACVAGGAATDGAVALGCALVVGGAAGGLASQGADCLTGAGSCSAASFAESAGAGAAGALVGGAVFGPVADGVGGLLARTGLSDAAASAAGRVAGGVAAGAAGYGATCGSDCSVSGLAASAALGGAFGAVGGEDGGACVGGQSFTASTQVLMADGTTKAISALKPGDKVEATSTKTGKTSAETVAAVEVNHDTDLYDLTVKTSGGTEVIHTTAAHLFWDPAKKKWVQAAKLAKGERLKTAHGQDAVADGGTTPATHDGWMWDLTVPGNNDHDFYVRAGQDGEGSTAILVHNIAMPCPPGYTARAESRNLVADALSRVRQSSWDTIIRNNLSDVELEAYYNDVDAGRYRTARRWVGSAVHNAVDAELQSVYPGRFQYNRSLGPDFYDTQNNVYVELTTRNQFQAHWDRGGLYLHSMYVFWGGLGTLPGRP